MATMTENPADRNGTADDDTAGNAADLDSQHNIYRGNSNRRQLPIRKLVYTASLLLALGIIEITTDANTFHAVQKHEPSIRIFRALFEMVLVLLCCAASISIWARYLGVPEVASLMFAPAESEALQTWTDREVEEDESSLLPENEVYDDSEASDQAKNRERVQLDNYAALIPSPIAIVSTALDLLVWILVTLVFHVVTAAQAIDLTNHESGLVRTLARVAAPTFPLFLFVFCLVRAVRPWKARAKLVAIVSRTLLAPWHAVTFRDGMIGDILTSLVRPMQDVAFTICYIMFGLSGWWSDSYFIPMTALVERNSDTLQSSSSFMAAADAYVPAMERSWLLHTAILPACMISPLWWRFLQNMRQTFDNKQRWPYLGNALKYFVAAQVAMIGVYQPHMQRNQFWLASFVFATLYQIYWDIFIDWGLFARDQRSGGAWKLRSQRLYPRKSMYWALAVVNTLLRFCWTLSFLPLRYLSDAGVLTNNNSSAEWASILAPTIASAEIIRRMIWGLLRIEWEAIKIRGDVCDTGRLEDIECLEMAPMKMRDGGFNGGVTSVERLPELTMEMSSMNSIQILGELCLYTAAFAAMGLIIAAHRGTM